MTVPTTDPAWRTSVALQPVVRVMLTPGGVQVGGEWVAADDPVASRRVGLAKAGLVAARLGRAVRAEAVELDGVAWPLVVHANGYAESAGVPSGPVLLDFDVTDGRSGCADADRIEALAEALNTATETVFRAPN